MKVTLNKDELENILKDYFYMKFNETSEINIKDNSNFNVNKGINLNYEIEIK